MLNNRTFLSLFILMLSIGLHAQSPIDDSSKTSATLLNGTVVNDQNQPLADVTVKLSVGQRQAQTDSEGSFQLAIADTNDQLQFTRVGYQPLTLRLDGNPVSEIPLIIRMIPVHTELGQAEVQGKSANRQLAERPILTQVINTLHVQNQPTTLVELLNRSAGIRVRQTGGLGAPANVMINGFQNRSIRYLKDGIPLDYLGAGFDVSLVPVDILQRVEVYKGVMPSNLGADALGGALNLITHNGSAHRLNASYEAGSFNTHRVAASVYKPSATKPFFIGLDAFYNYSDNDYRADLQVIDPNTGTLYPIRSRLFHNRFRNYYAEAYAGVRGTSWADELRFGIAAFGIDRQVNYGATMSQAIGGVTNHQQAIVPTIRYRKSFFEGKLSLDQFATWSRLHVDQVDTARGQYNWLGEFTPSQSRIGELNVRGSLSQLRFDHFTSRTLVSYVLHPNHQIDFNVVLNGYGRTGEDPFGQRFQQSGLDVLSARANYRKQVAGLGLQSDFLDRRLSNQLIVKYFGYQTQATDADYQGLEVFHQNNKHAFGLAEALKWNLSPYTYWRLSAETALRLPEQDELFGDGDRKLNNFGLLPERSLNLNLGFRSLLARKHSIEINSFYRFTKDLILQIPFNFLFSQSQNLEDVRGLGLEIDTEISLFRNLKAIGNLTYQDQRLHNTNNPTLEGSRLRNTPYFFGNISLEQHIQHLFIQHDELDLYWHFLFVRQYYLDTLPKDAEPDGFLGLWGSASIDARNIIPDQSLHTFGFTYRPDFSALSFGLQVKNVFDAPVFDNFRIQNPGRGIFLKLSYRFTKSTI